MLKKMKIGISLLLAFTMLVSTFNMGIITAAYATTPCTSLEECRELQREKRENIADMMEEEEEVNEYIALVQAEISILRDELAELEDNISDLESEIEELEGEIEELEGEIEELEGEIEELESEIAGLENEIEDLESEIADLEDEIADLEEDIEENEEILADTEEQIEDLIDEISMRMRITQRVNNTNSFLVILSEAENLADFVRRARTFNRFATSDAEIMEELNDLTEFQENLLDELEDQVDQLQDQTDQLQDQTDQLQDQTNQLQDQTDQLQEQTEQLQEQTDRLQDQTEELEMLKDELEVEQENLEEDQIALIERETELQDRLYELNLNLTEEEELLQAILDAEEVLARIPPPPIRTPSNNSSNSTQNSSNNTQNNSSNSAPITRPAPSSSGLAHPMPGARVTSEFGPRGGSHHTGIDLVIVGNPSAPILAAAAGTVTTNQWHGSLGWFIVISHNINGQAVGTLYAHLRYQSSVRVGTVVSQGERIGTKGSTGNSSGPHLHFEVHPGGWAWGNSVNPRLWINF